MSVTAADVAAWGKFPVPTGTDLTLLEGVVAAVADHLDTYYQLSDPPTPSQQLAVLMQCARLWRRRDTPDGIVAFDELGAIRVSRMDPDVVELLQPQWGVA